MQIIWDERKRLANLDKHGLDFVDLDANFFLAGIIRPAKMGRFMAIGWLAGGTITVIFGRLGQEGISIISMRRAHRGERSLLDEQKN